MADETNLVELTTDIVSAYVAHNNLRPEDVPTLIASTYSALKDLTGNADDSAVEAEAESFTPAVSIRKSLASKDQIISLIDGRAYKTLRRHLSNHGLTPEQYRARYGLAKDYPMTAPAYSDARREMAKRIGLGRKPGQKAGKAK